MTMPSTSRVWWSFRLAAFGGRLEQGVRTQSPEALLDALAEHTFALFENSMPTSGTWQERLLAEPRPGAGRKAARAKR